MPSVEPREVQVIFIRDAGSMERPVMRMAELDVLEPFVLGYFAVTDDLHLGLMRDGLQVWMEDGLLRGWNGIAVAVRSGAGIEAVGQEVLSAWCEVGLGFEDQDLVGKESVTDYGVRFVEEVTDFTGILPCSQVIISQVIDCHVMSYQ